MTERLVVGSQRVKTFAQLVNRPGSRLSLILDLTATVEISEQRHRQHDQQDNSDESRKESATDCGRSLPSPGLPRQVCATGATELRPLANGLIA